MKKKLLLIALPALMALSGCGNIQKGQPKVEEQPAIEFEEDTVAHEEIFGEAIEAKQPAIKRMGDLDDQPAYKIGYQIHFDNNSTPDNPNDDKISIRFIAAIKTNYDSMIWSRGVAKGNGVATIGFGDEKYGSSDKIASTVVYSSLSNGGEDLMRAGVAPYGAYSGFIVYSMRNIKYEANKDSYVAAMLTLHPAEGEDIVSSIYAVKVEKNAGGTASAKTFSFANDKDGFFLTGKIDGTNKEVNPDYPTREEYSGQNAASFTTNLQKGDSFLVAQKTSSAFKVWDSSCLSGSEASTYFADADGLITLKEDGEGNCEEGNYRFFLNTSNNLYATAPCSQGTDSGFYVRGSMCGDDWPALPEYKLVTTGSWNDRGVILNVHILANQTFQIANGDWSEQSGYWGYKKNGAFTGRGGENVIGLGATHFGYQDDSNDPKNIKCLHSGYYNIYLTDLNYVSIEVVSIDA